MFPHRVNISLNTFKLPHVNWCKIWGRMNGHNSSAMEFNVDERFSFLKNQTFEWIWNYNMKLTVAIRNKLSAFWEEERKKGWHDFVLEEQSGCSCHFNLWLNNNFVPVILIFSKLWFEIMSFHRAKQKALKRRPFASPEFTKNIIDI